MRSSRPTCTLRVVLTTRQRRCLAYPLAHIFRCLLRPSALPTLLPAPPCSHIARHTGLLFNRWRAHRARLSRNLRFTHPLNPIPPRHLHSTHHDHALRGRLGTTRCHGSLRRLLLKATTPCRGFPGRRCCIAILHHPNCLRSERCTIPSCHSIIRLEYLPAPCLQDLLLAADILSLRVLSAPTTVKLSS